MSDAALSERCAAALENPGPSKAMKAPAGKTWRSRRANVWSSHPAAGMEPPDASKAVKSGAGKADGNGRANVDSCGPAKPMQTTAPSKTWRRWRADLGNHDAGATEISGPAKAMKTTAASKAGRDRRAYVGNAGAVKLMETAAKAVESAAGKTRGNRRATDMETRRGMNAGGAKATKTWTIAEGMKGRSAARAQAPRRLEAGVNGVRRPGMGNDYAIAMMAPDHGAAKGVEVEGADPTKTIVPLVAALVPAAAVPAVVVVAIAAAELNCLHGR
jgi:hypothetical protein